MAAYKEGVQEELRQEVNEEVVNSLDEVNQTMDVDGWKYELRLFTKHGIDGRKATEALCHVREKFGHKISIGEVVGVQENMSTGKERPVRVVEWDVVESHIG